MKTKNQHFYTCYTVLQIIISFIISYSVLSLITWDYNIENWGILGRFIFILLGIIFYSISVCNYKDED